MSWSKAATLAAAAAVLIGACGGQNGKANNQSRNGDALEDSAAAVVRQAQRELDSLGQRAIERAEELGRDIQQEEVVETVEQGIDEAVQAGKTQIDSLAARMEREGTAEELGERVDNAVENAREQVDALLEQLEGD